MQSRGTLKFIGKGITGEMHWQTPDFRRYVVCGPVGCSLSLLQRGIQRNATLAVSGYHLWGQSEEAQVKGFWRKRNAQKYNTFLHTPPTYLRTVDNEAPVERKKLGAPSILNKVSSWLWREGECKVEKWGLWSQTQAGSKVFYLVVFYSGQETGYSLVQ